MTRETVGRWLLTTKGVEEGYLRIDGESLEEVCRGQPPADSVKGTILPAFVNAHTHIGDTVAFPAPKGTVKEIVGPPNGFKHRMLRSKSTDEKTAAMRFAVEEMRTSGTALFSDFREEGVEGLKSFRTAVEGGWPHAIVLGRPVGDEPSATEVDGLLRACDGLGFSAISDLPLETLKRMSRRARAAGKLFAMHASEAAREDIDSVLDLKPSFLVHMCKATDDDLVACREADVPIVVCPSSNRFFGLDPNIPRLLKAGVTVGLGTDNGMIVRPNMLHEMKEAYALSNVRGRVSPLEIVRLATFGGRKVLNADAKITTEISENTDLVVIRTTGDDPMSDLVTRAESEDILATIHGGKVGRTNAWTK